MQRNSDVNNLFRNLAKYDFIIGLFMVFIMYFAHPKYIVPLITGLFVASINFGLNIWITNYAMKSNNINNVPTIMISYYLRVIIIVVIAILFYFIDNYYLLLFCVGFSLHFVSLIINVLFNKN
ncbi:hypothetical protein SH2C18_09180 [Clostridium sediminicola]|uniref:ATP synthase subunit I n=1 Tax=Clostridium sediminicola TaxID=3114879 RepID=UPI0031F27A72